MPWKTPNHFIANMLGVLTILLISFTMMRPQTAEDISRNPDVFRFEYIYTPDEFRDSIAAILTRPIRKFEIDRIFVEIAGAQTSILKRANGDLVLYQKSTFSANILCPPGRRSQASWRFIVKYNEFGDLLYLNNSSGEETKFESLHPCL